MADQFNALEVLLEPDDALADPIKRKATAAALRRQNAMGVVGQLMGLEPTKAAGSMLQEQSQTSLRSALAKQQAQKEAAARAAEQAAAQKRWEAEQRQQAEQFRQQQALAWAQENRQAASSKQDEWSSPVADPQGGGWIVINKKDPTKFMRIDPSGQAVGPAAGAGGAGPAGLRPLQQPGGKVTEGEGKFGIQGGVTTDALIGAQSIIQRNPSAAKPGFLETAGTVFGLNPTSQQLLTQLGGGPDRGLVRTQVEGAIDAAITSMTGAAYTPEQLATYRGRFMPTILDTPQSRQAKMQDFMNFIRQQSVGAKNAWTPEREARLQQFAQMLEQAAGAPPAQSGSQAQGASPQSSGRNFEAEYGLGGQ